MPRFCLPRCRKTSSRPDPILSQEQRGSSAQSVAIIGAGIIGRSTAWHLQQQGHQVTLIAPDLLNPAGPAAETALVSGSAAALGLLMAQVFHRSSGRAWRLRQRSLALWNSWIRTLAARGHPVAFQRGLLLLASDPLELERQQRLVEQRQAMGLPLALWPRRALEELAPALPAAALGGLWSPEDGQIDPLPVLDALWQDAARLGCRGLPHRVLALESGRHDRWQLKLDDGSWLQSRWVVVGAGTATAGLLGQLGRPVPLDPVLGQALALSSGDPTAPWHWNPHWPAAVVWQGINLVPRADGQLWLGATLEPGRNPSRETLDTMAGLNGHAPDWLAAATVLRHWQGLRLRPRGRPAPWLELLAPGLLVASGHYRNGLLLAPASAEWISDQIASEAAGTTP